MQSECPDTDDLASIGAAFNWETERGIRHISSCESCRASLADLARLRTVLTTSVEPGSAFSGRVMSA